MKGLLDEVETSLLRHNSCRMMMMMMMMMMMTTMYDYYRNSIWSIFLDFPTDVQILQLIVAVCIYIYIYMHQIFMKTIVSNKILSDCNRILVFFVHRVCVCRRSLRFLSFDTFTEKFCISAPLRDYMESDQSVYVTDCTRFPEIHLAACN